MTFENSVIALLCINIFVNILRINQLGKDYKQGLKDGMKLSFDIGKSLANDK